MVEIRKKRVAVEGTTELVPGIESKIYLICGSRVMLSHDLAQLYGIETRVLMQAVRRNLDRFPSDFQFLLTNQELTILISQSVTSSWGGTRKAPMAFTEQGVAMLSGVLKSSEAVAVNIEIMRTFVKLRGMQSEHSDLKRKYDENFKMVFDAIHQMMDEPGPGAYGRRRIGFTNEK